MIKSLGLTNLASSKLQITSGLFVFNPCAQFSSVLFESVIGAMTFPLYCMRGVPF